jgi:hypothetical protein
MSDKPEDPLQEILQQKIMQLVRDHKDVVLRLLSLDMSGKTPLAYKRFTKVLIVEGDNVKKFIDDHDQLIAQGISPEKILRVLREIILGHA